MTPETPAGWLALAALAIGALVRLLKTDTLNTALMRLGAPKPIPKRALPWVAVGVGVAAGFVTGLQQGKGWRGAMLSAAQGFVSGIGAIAGHELIIESANKGQEVLPPGPPPPNGGGGGAPLAVLLLVGALALPAGAASSGCAMLRGPAADAADTFVEKALAKCVAEAASTDEAAVGVLCGVAGPAAWALLRELLQWKRVGLERAAALRGGYRDAYDAGAD